MLNNNSKVILLACGTFNPVTNGHLRMMEAAKDYLVKKTQCIVLEGVLSPVSDKYEKAGMAFANHRYNMLQLAVKDSKWLSVSDWEIKQPKWSRLVEVTEAIKKDAIKKHGLKEDEGLRVMFVCGGDVIDSFSIIKSDGSSLWSRKDVERICKEGVVCMDRPDTRYKETLKNLNLFDYIDKSVFLFKDEICPNNISSTRIRQAVKEGITLKYCTPDLVSHYITSNSLYLS